MKLGVIGLPGSGKTTIFEALTRNFSEGGGKTENRIGTIKVPDSRVDVLHDMYQPKKTTFAHVEYSLPASQGSKKDDLNWNRIRECDGLIHVVRNFTGLDGEPPNPTGDFQALDQEMILMDQVVVEKRMERLEADRKRGKKADVEEEELLHRCLAGLENAAPLRRDPDLAHAKALRGFTFLTAKPMLAIINNADEDDNAIVMGSDADRTDSVVVKGKLEHELARMTPEESAEFMREYHIRESATDRVIHKSYELMGLISFFTVGADEVRAWTIPGGTVAVDAAEVIHSDFKKGFIRAEVVAYDDLMAAGSYAEARKRASVRLEGKTYPVKDGDIINFRFNV